VTWAIGKISGAANDDPTFENYSVVSALQSLAVRNSTSASGAPENASLSHFAAMTRPCWPVER